MDVIVILGSLSHTHTHTHLIYPVQSEFVNIYSAYLNEFKVAVKTLAKYEQSSSQFRELLSMCQHSPFCEGLSLASYLLTPVQRLPRYELLLKVCRSHDYHMISIESRDCPMKFWTIVHVFYSIALNVFPQVHVYLLVFAVPFYLIM